MRAAAARSPQHETAPAPPRALRHAIPRPVRRGLRSAANIPPALMGCATVLLNRWPSPGTVQVFYGYRTIPRTDQTAHGGIIKFQRMQGVFPNSPGRCNILYLVSSRMPPGAVEMVRLAKRKRLRVVWNQNGVAYPAWHGPGWERTNAPLADVLHAADYVFYQSQFCQLSADKYLGKRDGPSEVLWNAVDTDVFTPVLDDPDPDGLVMLLGGSQFHWYRLEAALQVLARVANTVPHARLLVTGRLCWIPDEQQALRIAKQRAKQLQVEDRVTCLGSYRQVDAPSIFQSAHLLLHTQYNDSCPGVVLEAMACGLPVVYSRSGGVAELVGDDAGIGVPTELSWEREIPPDPDALASAVLQVAAQRKRFSQAARARAVDRFDLQPWLRRHQEVFEELCR